MSSEAWALVGVVVGALIGGGAQVVADALRRRHDRRSAIRVDRREAYSEFLAASSEALGPIATSRAVYEGEPSAESRPSDIIALQNASGALIRMSVAASRIQLVAPDDTHLAARGVHAAIMMYMFRDEDGMADQLADSQLEFARLARRDLAQ